MSIKMKILTPIVVLTIISTTLILVFNISSFSTHTDNSIKNRVGIASAVASDEIETLKSSASNISAYMAEDPKLVEAMENGGRDALLARSKQLMSMTGVGFCTISDASGTVIARPHNPEAYGDDVTGLATVKSAMAGKSLTAIEEGVPIRLSVCSGTPIYDDQGKLLGVVCVGFRLDTDEFVDSVKAILGCETTVFLKDERISTTVVKDGARAVGTKAAAGVSETVLAGNAYAGQAKVLDRDALTKYIPISGPDGKAIGMLFVGYYMNEKTDTVREFVQEGLLVMLIIFAVSTPIILLVVKRIVNPINTMVKAADALASGNTDISVQVNTKDEMRRLADAFNNMIESTREQSQIIKKISDGDLTVSIKARSDKDVMNNALDSMLTLNNDVFSQISVSADQVSSGAKQIADASQSLAQGATEQAAAVEELSSSINEVNNQIKDSAAMAADAEALASLIKANAEKGASQMKRMTKSVEEIDVASQSIGKIIKVIDDIAFQTNILALNAAVEAARAGHHGKGFAVVAEEVRNLATKSSEAAKDTSSLIEASMEKAGLGVRIAGEMSAFLDDITSGILKNSQIVNEIATISGQQRAAIAQINEGIGQVSQVVQQNSATAEESAAASEELSGQSDMLREMTARFKLKTNSGVIGISSGDGDEGAFLKETDDMLFYRPSETNAQERSKYV